MEIKHRYNVMNCQSRIYLEKRQNHWTYELIKCDAEWFWFVLVWISPLVALKFNNWLQIKESINTKHYIININSYLPWESVMIAWGILENRCFIQGVSIYTEFMWRLITLEIKISALVISFYLFEVIWLLFKTQMKDDLMQNELSY